MAIVSEINGQPAWAMKAFNFGYLTKTGSKSVGLPSVVLNSEAKV